MLNALRAVSLAVLFLTLLATTASAECAWVLWKKTSITRVGETYEPAWDPRETFSTRKECEVSQTRHWRAEAKTFKRDAKRGDVVVADRSDQETHVFYASADKTIAWESRIRCLPAGTDPREPRR